MTTNILPISVGDLVRIRETNKDTWVKKYLDRVGEVVAVYENSSYPYEVRFIDDKRAERFYYLEIELAFTQ